MMNRAPRTWVVLFSLVAAVASTAPACKKNSSGFIAIANPGSLGFSAAAYSVAEEGGTATITVSRSGGSTGLVHVWYAITNGSATAADYASGVGQLFWADGDAADKTFTVTVTGDALSEGNETVNLFLNLPAGGAVVGQADAVLTILDNDTPGGTGALQYDAPTYTVGEGAGSLTVSVTRSGGSTGAASATVSVTGGTATGADYSLAAAAVNWAAGETGPKTVTLTIVDDGLAEGGETLNLGLSGITGATAGTQTTSVVTITDNDSPGTLALASTLFLVNESGVSAEITVVRTGGSSGPVGVNFATADGTATLAGSDYTAASGTLSWGDGDTSPKSFIVPILDDSVVEADETVGLTISGPTGGAALGQASATLNIVNDDTSIQFSAATYSVAESGVTATITATRLGTTVGAVGVTWATSDGTALAASDYTGASNTLAWANGDGANKTFTVAIANDTVSEGSETVNLALSSPTGGATLGAQSTAVLTILDNPGILQFSAATYSVNEAGASVTITATRTQGRGGAASVTYGVNGGAPGTATGADFAIVGTTLNWADQDGADKTFTVTITNETAVEGNETVGLLLSGATGATVGAQGTAVLTIVDNDVTIQYAAATYSVNEAAGPVTITATRVGTSVGQVTVSYTYTDQTASYLTDYTYAPVTLTWADGDMLDKTYTVAITNDNDLEGAETFLLTLIGPSATLGTQATIGAPGSTQVTIVDDDVPGTIQFQTTASTTAEGAAALTITATRTAGSGGTVGATYAVSGASTAGGAEYSLTGTLSWGPGDNAPKILTLTPAANDASSEGAETVVIDLTGASGGASLGANTTHTVSIADSPGTIQFVSATYSQQEANSGNVSATVTVSRTGGRGGAVGIQFSTSTGGATPATVVTDYTAVTNSPYTWPDDLDGPYNFFVTIAGDGSIESTETVLLGLSGISGGATLGLAAATLSIVDSPGVLQFSSSLFTGNEPNSSTANALVTVTRTVGSGGIVGVSLSDLGGAVQPATSGVDFNAISGVAPVSFAAGSTTPLNFSVVLNSDGVIEPTETVNLGFTAFTGGATAGAQTTATLNIVDSPGTLTFSSAAYSVQEPAGSGSVLITVNRVNGSGPAVGVTYSSSDGSATQPADYTAVPGGSTLNWGPGDTTQRTFNVAIQPDAILEGDHTFNLALSAATGGAALGTSAAVVTIDDSPGLLQFQVTSITGNAEGAPAITVNVTRTNGSGGAASVNYAFNSGLSSAIAGDFTTAGTLTWGDLDGATKSFTVTLVDDALVESNENIILDLTGASGASIGAQAQISVQIVENDSAVQFSQATFSGAEGTTASFTVTRTGSTAGAVSVSFAVNGAGTNAAPADYSILTSSPVTLGAGVTSALISVSLVGDVSIEGTENLMLTLSAPSPAATTFLGAQINGTMNIIDSPGSVVFSATPYAVAENVAAGFITVTATRIGGNGGPVSATLSTIPGSALAGSDYTTVSTTVSWADGVTGDFTVNIPILNDAVGENTETFSVHLSNPSPVGITLAPDETVTVTDDDTSIRFLSATFNGAEVNGSTPTYTVTVERIGTTAGSIVGTWTLDTAPAAGRATFTTDYTATGAASTGTLNWANGEGGNKTFDIIVADDALGEGTETIPMTIAVTGGTASATTASPSAATFNVIDDELTLQFTQATYTFNENAGLVTIAVSRTGTTAGAVTVVATASNGSAGAGDYSATPNPQTLSWANLEGGTKNFTFTITEDTLVEALESFTVALSGPTGGASLGTPSTATVEIISNDSTIQFSTGLYTTDEQAGTFQVTVTRTGDTTDTDTVQFGIATPAGSAQSGGVDYSLTPSTLSFGVGVTSQTFDITLINDSAAEGTETINLLLFGQGGTNVQLGAQSTASVNLQDNDIAIQFEFLNYNVNENVGGGSATIAVRRIGSTAGQVTVSCSSVAGGTALAGTDYTSTTSTLTWNNGVGGLQNFNLPIINDTDLDPNETVFLQLSSFTLVPASGELPGTTVVPGTPVNATLTIIDDDQPGTLQFLSNSASGTEGGGTVNIEVTRTAGSGGAVTATYSVTPGTATTPGDFTHSATLSWAAGDTASKFIVVSIVNDATAENQETATFTLTGTTGGAVLGGSTVSTLTINDNDTGFRFTSATQSVSEGVGTVTVSIERVGSTSGLVNVDAVFDGVNSTATNTGPSPDFNFSSSATVSWNNLEGGTKNVTLNIINDTMTELNETIILNLANQTGGTSLVSPSTHTVTITNDDGPTMVNAAATANSQIALSGAPSTNISPSTNIWIRFSEPMVTGTVSATITRAGGGPVPTLYYFWNSPTNTELTIAFDTSIPTDGLFTSADLLAPGETYTITLASSSQGATTGITMGSNDRTLDFQTRTDDSPPTLVSISSTVGGTATGQDPRTTLLTGAVDGFDFVFFDPSGMQTTSGQAWVSTQSTEYQDMIENPGPQVDNGNPGADNMIVTWSGSTFRIRFLNSVTLQPRSLYRINISSINDMNWNWLPWTNIAAVTAGTEAPNTAPAISGSAPFNTQTNVSRDSGVFVGFTEIVTTNITQFVTVTASPGGNITANCEVNYDGYMNGVGVRSKTSWPSGATITIAIGAGATDCAGNALAATSISFTVETNTATTGIEVDTDFSTLQPNGGVALQANTSQWNWGGSLKFRYTQAPNGRAYVNLGTILPQHFLMVEEATGAPFKGIMLDTQEEGEIRLRNGNGVQMSGDTIFVLTMTAGPTSSRGGALTPAVHRFRTVGPPPGYTLTIPFPGPVTWSNNARPILWSSPWTEFDSRPSGTLIMFDTGGNNDNTDQNNPSPFNSNWNENVTLNASNTPGTLSLFTPLMASTSSSNSNFNFNYSSSGAEFTGNSGSQVITFTLSDTVNTWSVKWNGYVFPTFPTPTVNVSAPYSPTLPRYEWTGLDPNAEAAIVRVERASDGMLVAEWVVNRGSGGSFQTAGNFVHPADQPLQAGTQYRFILWMFKSEDNTLGNGGGNGNGEVLWTTP